MFLLSNKNWRVTIFAARLAALFTAAPCLAADEATENIAVLQISPELEGQVHDLVRTFQRRGTSAVADLLSLQLMDEARLAAWRKLVAGEGVHVVDVEVHPNEAAAIDWMNHRFRRMGLPNLRFSGQFDASRPDPTALDPLAIRPRKWLRYAAGPGMAMAAFLIGLPSHAAATVSDSLYLMIPAASVGVTTVVLEMQFAWPWLNNHFWKKAWRFGGAVGGRVSNVLVNFLYGMALYGASVGGAHLSSLLAGAPVEAATAAVGFVQAVTAAAIGAVTFHLAMGQFQTDISTEEDHGAITAQTRYALETSGTVVTNGARVASWVLPASNAYLGWIAQAGFFLLKTLPQMLKSHIADRLADHQIARRLATEPSPRPFFDRCAEILGSLQLVNLPRAEK